MIEIPKIAIKRLAIELPAEAVHPDADLLSAFAEQSLPAAEREQILGHLALCGSCREVVALAIPEAVAATPTFATPALEESDDVEEAIGSAAGNASRGLHPKKFSLSRFVVPNLRWAALAAGVVLAAALAMVRSGNLNLAKLEPNQSGARTVTTPSTPEKTSANESPAAQPAAEHDSASRRSASKVAQSSNGTAAPPPASVVTRPSIDKSALAKKESRDKPKVEETLPSNSLIAQAEPGSTDNAKPIVRAKPVPQTEQSAGMAGVEIWTVNNGVLQRSNDGGQTWKDALPANHQILCYANQDRQVWAGGKQGALFYSSDNGSNWTPVQPSFQGKPLASDVLNIELRGASQIVLSTSNNTTWTSGDQGSSWQRK
jgi:hypothetical protein